jgi:diguanylate cyclase (GGDEF)-like protein
MRLTTAEVPTARPLVADNVSRRWAFVILIVAMAGIFELDRITASAPVQHLYYLPIIFAARRFGRSGALGIAAAATILYHLANPHLFSFHYEEVDVVQIILFGVVGLVAAKLTDDARQLRRLAMTDDLTGLHNLRSFQARLLDMVGSARQSGTPLAMLVLDLDRLKAINDAHGHLVGAEAVRLVGRLIGRALPPGAVACRYGGDEFVVALPDCDSAGAAAIARDLCAMVRETTPLLAGVKLERGALAISVGVACGHEPLHPLSAAKPDDAQRGEALFRAADAALYLAKNNGRNRVSLAPRDAWSWAAGVPLTRAVVP